MNGIKTRPEPLQVPTGNNVTMSAALDAGTITLSVNADGGKLAQIELDIDELSALIADAQQLRNWIRAARLRTQMGAPMIHEFGPRGS